MWTVENHFKVRLGGNTYIDVGNLVVYKGQTLFTLKRHEDNGQLGIYFELYDSKGNHVASVKRNQIYQPVQQKELYSISGSAEEYSLREVATGEVVCKIRKRPTTPVELEVSVRLYTPDGFLFNATPASTNLGGIVLVGNTFVGGSIGINIE
jgi:hypothetical protein